MIKTIFNVTIFVAALLWIGNVRISFSPFSFQLPAWRLVIAWLFFVVALAFFQMHFTRRGIDLGFKTGYDAGYNKARDQVVSIIREEKQKQETPSA